MDFVIPDLKPAIAEMFILGMACFALIMDLFTNDKEHRYTYYIVQLALIGAFIISLDQFHNASQITFSGNFISDKISHLLKLFIYITSFMAFMYGRQYVLDREFPRGEYYILGLFSVLGMMVLVSANSFLTIYLGLEVLSLPLYAMVALRRDSVTATEAAMKYFVMGAMASGMLLYGISMLYGATGNLEITHVAVVITNFPANKSLILSFGLVFIVVGLGFKLAAAPFHMWAPDVYQGAPTSVALFISSATKIAALGMLLRLFYVAMPGLFIHWQSLFIVMAVLSIVLGNLIAIAQTNLKRLFAYSAISHMGYMLFGVIAGTQAGYAAAMHYMIIYALMSAGGFAMIIILSGAGIEAENIEDFKGLNQKHPWLAFMMLILLFSMAGVPPTVGFFAKLFVLKALVDVHLVWLATLGIIFAIVGAYYYIRIVKVMYFDVPEKAFQVSKPLDSQLLISINGLALLVMGIFPGILLHFCRLAFGL